jgi:transcriptional regulator with XRE-family HTH domain
MATWDQLTPGQRLKDVRARRQMTQIEVAVKAKCAPGTIAFAERDERVPNILTQERIAKALSTRANPVTRRDLWSDEPAEAAV